MNTVIYYFSATGNSLAVARDLAAELGSARVIPVTEALRSGSEQDCDAVGFVFPVYMFGLPLIVAAFLRSLKVKPGAYVFSVATFGGLQGRAHTMARMILRKNGIELAAGFSVLMPGNYTPLYGAPPLEKQQEAFDKEKPRVKEIAQAVRSQKRGIMEEKPFLANLLLYLLLYRGGSAQIPLSAKNFWVTDACIKCEICGRVCPVGNIQMKDGKPSWLDHCQHCMACLQWCPVDAIQYKKSTVGRKRYHHPAIKPEDIMAQHVQAP